MTVTADKTLTVEKVPAYLAEHSKEIGVFPSDAKLVANTINGGNVNFAFRVVCDSDPTEKPIFVKQAPEYVAIFGPDGYPLTSYRMQLEIDIFDEWKTILGEDLASKYLPKIYLFDKSSMVIVMEFLDGYELLDHVLVEKGTFHPGVAEGLGEFLGMTHAATHTSKVSKERFDYLRTHYKNQPMRDIQLEFVFSKCFKEATEEQRAGLNLNDEFMNEVSLLKKQYNGDVDTDNLVLSHGDIHPGSVMVNMIGDAKVIDPEFTVYGPPGLDVGSLLSGFVLAAIHHAFSNNPDTVNDLCDGAEAIWSSYKTTMEKQGISSDVIRKIEVQTVGFTVTEVCRTALEFAGGRKWLQFEDKTVKKASIKAALEVVDKCMVKRHEGGMQILFDEMKAVVRKN